MDVLRRAQEAINVLQKLIDSGRDDGNLVVVIIQDKCSIGVLGGGEVSADDANNELTRPAKVRGLDMDEMAEDLLGAFLNNIEGYLRGDWDYGSSFEYLSATSVKIVINVEKVCDIEEGAEFNENVREIFFRELPNIMQLYRNVGWDVQLEDEGKSDGRGLRAGNLVFVGELSKTPYRKLLNDVSSETEGAELTSPETLIVDNVE